MWTILMSNQTEKNICDKKLIKAPPHMAKKKKANIHYFHQNPNSNLSNLVIPNH